jgi:hypothetical protein
VTKDMLVAEASVSTCVCGGSEQARVSASKHVCHCVSAVSRCLIRTRERARAIAASVSPAGVTLSDTMLSRN